MGLVCLLLLLYCLLSLNNLTVLSTSVPIIITVARLSRLSLLSCPDFCMLGNIFLLDSDQLELETSDTFGDSDSSEKLLEPYAVLVLR